MKINYIPLLISLVFVSCIEQQKTTQNPSPMEEHIRPHIRIDDRTCDGEEIELEGVFEHPITLFIQCLSTACVDINIDTQSILF